MKKNFLAICALVGALVASPVFTSCVDNEESPSVTQLRGAKAEQLKALAEQLKAQAALYSAQAQSEAITAAADAALKNAQAEAQLAQAKYQEANAELVKINAALQETKVEEEKVHLEEAKIALEIAKKNAEAELARIQNYIAEEALRAEAELIRLEAQLLNAKKQLENTTENLANEEKAKIQQLANEYSNAVNNLLNAKRNLAVLNAELAILETGLTDAKANLEKTVANYNNQIALNNIRIESYKQYANYTEDIDALKAEYTTLEAAKNKAEAEKNDALNKYYNIEIDEEAISEAAKAVLTDDFYKLATESWGYWDEEKEEYIEISPVDNYIDGTIFNGGNYWMNDKEYWYINGSNNEKGYSETKYEYNDHTAQFGHEIAFEYEAGDLAKVEMEVYNNTEWQQNEIKNLEEAVKTNQTALETAKTAEATAKKEWEEAEEADKDSKKYAYETALNDRLAIEESIENDTERIEELKKDVANKQAILEMFKNAETLNAALQEKIKTYNETVKAAYAERVEAWKLTVDTAIAYEEADAEYQAVNNILYGNNSALWLNQEIERLENYNENYEIRIEEAEKLLSDWYHNNHQLSYETVIEFKKDEIAAQEAVVAAIEVAVEEAKAALDAAMPKAEEAE